MDYLAAVIGVMSESLQAHFEDLRVIVAFNNAMASASFAVAPSTERTVDSVPMMARAYQPAQFRQSHACRLGRFLESRRTTVRFVVAGGHDLNHRGTATGHKGGDDFQSPR